MRVIIDDDGERIETGERDLNENDINVYNMDGFGATDVAIDAGPMTWDQWDKLKLAMAEAERRWRKA